MTIQTIPTKQDKNTITDSTHLLSAEEFNIVVNSIRNILGVLLTLDEYDALATKDSDTYYYIVDSTSGGDSGDDSGDETGTTGSVSGLILTLTNANISGETLTITNATISGNILTIN